MAKPNALRAALHQTMVDALEAHLIERCTSLHQIVRERDRHERMACVDNVLTEIRRTAQLLDEAYPPAGAALP